MISMRIFNYSTHFPLFLLLSIAISPLVSAIDWGLGPKDPDPDHPRPPLMCDYPTTGYINSQFTYPGRSKSVLIADVGGLQLATDEPYTYCLQTGKSSIYDSYPMDLLLLRRSERWYDDFVARLQRKFIEASKGEVTLLSRYPLGPRLPPGDITCHFWWRYAFPALKDNPDVTRIILVNPLNYADRRTYWRRGGPDADPEKLYPEDRPRLPSGGGFGSNLNGLLPALGLGGTGAVPVIGAGEGLINGIPRGSAPVPHDTKDKTSNFDSQWLDLPDLDQLNPQNGRTSMLPEETTEFPSLDIFQRRGRRRRDLFNPSLSGICLDWAGVPSRGPDGKVVWGVRPTFEYDSMPSPAIGDSPQGNLQGSQQSQFSSNDYVTVQVTQYARGSPPEDPSQPVSDNYRLDITILDPAGQTSGEVKSQDAPSGQDVDVTSPVVLRTLHVITGVNDYAPISFRLGDNDQQWDSTHTDDDHKCGTSPWADGKRQITCAFQIVAGRTDIPGGQTPIDQFHLHLEQAIPP